MPIVECRSQMVYILVSKHLISVRFSDVIFFLSPSVMQLVERIEAMEDKALSDTSSYDGVVNPAQSV